jgi:cytochrome c biogenesis protein CcmG/thiol:disulfide interchange protein DsbE
MSQRNAATISIGLLVLILVGASLYYFFGPGHRHVESAAQPPAVGKAQIGQPAPNFEVATTSGLFDLSKTTKPVFLEVFATWCPHCQRETVVIDRLYRAYRSRVDFVGVSGSQYAMDSTTAASELDLLDWVRRFHVEYPVAYDPLLNVANLYLQGGFPTIVIIARDKKVTYLNSGELSYQELAGAIEKVLR